MEVGTTKGTIGARSKSQVTKVALCGLVKSPWVEGSSNSNDQLAGRRDPSVDQLVDHHCAQCAIICDDNTTN